MNSFFRLLAQGFQGGTPFRVHLQGEGHVAVLDLQARNHALGYDIGARLRIGDGIQGFKDLLFGDLAHGCNLQGMIRYHSVLAAPMRVAPMANLSYKAMTNQPCALDIRI